MGSQGALTATSTAIWPKNVGTKRKRKKPEDISSVTKKDTLQRTVKKAVNKETKGSRKIR